MDIGLKKIILTAFVGLYLSSCCSWGYNEEDFVFTQQESERFGPYKIGDTIYFGSNTGDLDTITIVGIEESQRTGRKCFSRRAPANSKRITIKHLPMDYWHGSTIKPGEHPEIIYQRVFSIVKLPLKKETHYSVSFKSFIFMDTTLGEFYKQLTINGRLITDSYRLKHTYPERILKPDDIETVYWTDKNGLTAYTNKSGETWTIKNVK